MTFLAGAVALLLLWWFGRNLKIRHPALTARVLRQVGGYAALALAALFAVSDAYAMGELLQAAGMTREQVLQLVARLRERGLGVILISHNLADVFQVADRIEVLRLGRNAARFDAADVTTEALSPFFSANVSNPDWDPALVAATLPAG